MNYKRIMAPILIAFLVGVICMPLFESIQDIRQAWSIPLSGRIIMLDAGHGGPDGGAVSESGVLEKDVTLAVALRLRDLLQQAGALVIMTRERDVDLARSSTNGLSRRKTEDLVTRVKMIRSKKADLLISIHLNAIPSGRWRGSQTFYNPIQEENGRLAAAVQEQLITNMENTDRFPKQKNDVYILRQSPVPTALIEVGFLSNSEEAALLANNLYQKKLAGSIYYGIIAYYARLPLTKFDW